MIARLNGRKGLAVGAGALGAFVGAYLVGSATLGAFAHDAAEGGDRCSATPTYTSSIQIPRSGSERHEADGTKALAKLATVTTDQARAAALGRFSGGTVKATRLESDDGQVVYRVVVTDAAGVEREVMVDAGTAAVLQVQDETNGNAERSACD